METEIKNAVIKSISIDDAGRGILTAWLHLDYGEGGQGFGGYGLYLPEPFKHQDIEINHAGHFIWRCMEIGGVSKWQDLVGKTIRVKGQISGIEAIGHVIKDDWFNPKEEFDTLKKKPAVRDKVGGR